MSTIPRSARIALAWIVAAGPFLAAGVPVGTGDGAGTRPLEIRGEVVDTSGGPIVGARVELRAGARTVSSATSRTDGTFRLVVSSELVERLPGEEFLLHAARMGFHPGEETVEPMEEPFVRMILVPAPLPLPGFRVEVASGECTADGPGGIARRLWERAAERHPGGMDTLGAASYMMVRVDTFATTPVGGAGATAGSAESGEAGQRGSAPILRIGWSRRIDREGYAFPVRRTDRDGSYASWSYAPLEADFAPHFGTRQFGELHYFRLVGEGSDGWAVSFCPRDRSRPHIQGRLEIGSDTLLRRAEWEYGTPEPHEDAGGWAIFPPHEPGASPPPLLPLEGMSWRTVRGELTIRRAQWFEGWVLAPGDSVPFLPRRGDF